MAVAASLSKFVASPEKITKGAGQRTVLSMLLNNFQLEDNIFGVQVSIRPKGRAYQVLEPLKIFLKSGQTIRMGRPFTPGALDPAGKYDIVFEVFERAEEPRGKIVSKFKKANAFEVLPVIKIPEPPPKPPPKPPIKKVCTLPEFTDDVEEWKNRLQAYYVCQNQDFNKLYTDVIGNYDEKHWIEAIALAAGLLIAANFIVGPAFAAATKATTVASKQAAWSKIIETSLGADIRPGVFSQIHRMATKDIAKTFVSANTPLKAKILQWLTEHKLGVLAGSVSAIVGVMGFGAFMSFLVEEILQTSGLGVWVAMSNKKWKIAAAALKKHLETITWAEATVDLWSIVSPISADVFRQYIEASKQQAVIYGNLIIAQEDPGTKPLVYEKGSFQKFVDEKIIPKLDELIVKPVVVPEPVLTFAQEQQIRDFKDNIETSFFSTKDAIGIKRFDLAEQSIAAFEDGIENFEIWITENTELLTAVNRYEEITSYIDAQKNRATTLEAQIKAGREGVPEPVPTPPPVPIEEEEEEMGTVIVQSTPTAKIFIGGKDTGEETPHTFELLPGTHDFVITAPMHRPRRSTVFLSAGETKTLSLVLEEIPADLPRWKVTVSSEPSGAKILVNGEFTGKWTPDFVILLAGEYTIGVTKSGFEPGTAELVL